MSLDIDALYRAYHAHIRGYIARRMDGYDDAVIDDLASEVWARAVKAAPDYQDRGAHPKGWLYQIATRLIVDRYREGSRRAVMLRLGDLKPYAEHVGTDDHVAQIDCRITISKALETYQTGNSACPPDAHLAVIHEKYFVGGYDREVGEALGMTEMSVKKIKQRALANLKKMLEAS